MRYILRALSPVDYRPKAKRARMGEPQNPIKYKSLEQQQIAKLESEINILKKQNDEKENDLKLLREKTERSKHLEEESHLIQTENQNLKLQLSELEKQKECLTSSIDEKAEALQEAKAENNRITNDLKGKIEQFKQLLEENNLIQTENQNLKLKLSELEKQKECLTLPTSSIEGGAGSLTNVVEDFEIIPYTEHFRFPFPYPPIKIHKKVIFGEIEKNIMKNNEAANNLVKFIDENVFDDTIKNFVIRSMTLLFTQDFFMDKLSYKHEAWRVCYRETKFFKCLMESIKNNFPEEKIPSNLLLFIKNTIYDFKQALRQSEHLWDAYL